MLLNRTSHFHQQLVTRSKQTPTLTTGPTPACDAAVANWPGRGTPSSRWSHVRARVYVHVLMSALVRA
eukprot:11838585-Alexandrium_andersonii.AAC.1